MIKKTPPSPGPAATPPSRSASPELVEVLSTAHLPEVTLYEPRGSPASPSPSLSPTPAPSQVLAPPSNPPKWRRTASYAEVVVHFHQSRVDAARDLNMSQNNLVATVRSMGFPGWPSRQTKSIKHFLKDISQKDLRVDYEKMGLEEMARRYYAMLTPDKAQDLTSGALAYFKNLLRSNGVDVTQQASAGSKPRKKRPPRGCKIPRD